MQELARRLQESFESFGRGDMDVSSIEALYREDMYFRDPIQELHGRDAFIRMNEHLLRNFKSLSFEVRRVSHGADFIHLRWDMGLEPRLGPKMAFEGMTELLAVEGRIASHIDYWDLWSSIARPIPLVGPLYRRIVGLMG